MIGQDANHRALAFHVQRPGDAACHVVGHAHLSRVGHGSSDPRPGRGGVTEGAAGPRGGKRPVRRLDRPGREPTAPIRTKLKPALARLGSRAHCRRSDFLGEVWVNEQY